MQEHEEILLALESRDGMRLAAILKGHLRNKCDAVKEVLKTETAENTDA